jgi:cation:H+ antiporter
MGQALCFIFFVVGLVAIIKGSDWFIDAVIWVSNVFKIPYIIIGATIVSICTTLPETFVSVTAALKNQSDFAFGNAIGSIAVNTGFIMAIMIIFAKPKIDKMKDFIRNGVFLIALLLFTLFVGTTIGEINRFIGALLVCLLIVYLVNNVINAKRKTRVRYEIEREEDMEGEIPLYEGVAMDVVDNEIDISRKVILKYTLSFIAGIALVVIGSNLLVDNGIKIAELLGVPPFIIAVTFTALGTSLPELVTTITSIRKNATNIGVGNIIGANILNIIQVVGISSIIRTIPLAQNKELVYIQIPIVLAIVVFAVLFGVIGKSGYKRWNGLALLAIYSVFVISTVS